MAKCQACGSDLRFEPSTQKLTCDACGNSIGIAEHNEVTAQQADGVKEYVCPQCGGSIFTTDSTAATFCSFCGTSVVLEPRDAEYEKPDGIIPFSVTRDDAKDAYLKKIRKSLFAPSSLKQDNKVEKVRGIYMPYQVARYQGNGWASITSLHRHTSGNYDITDTMRDTMQADVSLDVTHDALREFSDVISEGITPFDFDDIKDYSSAYLSGFYADKPDVDKDALQAGTKAEVKQLCEDAVVRRVIGNNELKKVETMPEIRCDHINTLLCPVWFISNKQPNGTVSYAAVNGQTGEVSAEIPIDKQRFGAIAGVISIIAYIILILTMSFTPHNALGLMASLALVAAYVLYEEAEELYVHNKEMEGVEVPVKQSKRKKQNQPNPGMFMVYFVFLGPFVIWLLHWMTKIFGAAGFVVVGLGAFILCKAKLRQYAWFQRVFGLDYQIPKGALLKYIAKPLGAAIFAMLMFAVNPVQDIVQYISAGIVFCLTLWACLDIIRVHNQMASRKPAQLKRRGGDERA